MKKLYSCLSRVVDLLKEWQLKESELEKTIALILNHCEQEEALRRYGL